MREKIQETVAQQQASGDKPKRVQTNNVRSRIAQPEAPVEKDSSFFDTFIGKAQNKTFDSSAKNRSTYDEVQTRSVYLPPGDVRLDLPRQ